MKLKFGPVPLIYPIPVTLVGAKVAGKPNYTTIGDCGLTGINPPVVFISSHREHHINKGIMENGAFSINFLNTKMLPLADYCGMVSGRDIEKASLFQTFYGELEEVPMISECPVCLECRLVEELSIKHRQVFIGEVIQTHVDEAFVSNGKDRKSITDLRALDPIIYALDNKYYRVGQ